MEESQHMDAISDPRALDDCVVALDEEGQKAVRQYWEQVIREEWVPAARPVPRAVSMAELDERRERRSARRAVARIAAASRLAQVHRLATPAGGFEPGEAA
jgi:hypothetical protein